MTMMEDITIVDINSLESAISSFKTSSNAIGTIASDLQTNSGQIAQSMISAASDTYQRKMANLVKNVQTSQSELQRRIQDLSNYCESSRIAEKTAESIADSISEKGFMQ